MPNSSDSSSKWQSPRELLKLQKLRFKKQALQERINGNGAAQEKRASTGQTSAFEDLFNSRKRKNPFARQAESKKCKTNQGDASTSALELSETGDQTLFKLLNGTPASDKATTSNSIVSFNKILSTSTTSKTDERVPQCKETTWCPLDWTLKRKLRLISPKPFPWTSKLNISEESSGLTSFTRCLDMEKCDTSLDVSPNARFHQCCLYWQHPSLPWLSLFPRNTMKDSSGMSFATNNTFKKSLYETWTDSLKSLFQLIRTRQCPYFYVCANSFTALFRAAGISSHVDLHVMVTPTTRGFRSLLKEADIEFEMPLKIGSLSTQLSEDRPDSLVGNLGNEPVDDENEGEEDWLTDLGVNAEDIRNINYTQDRIQHKTECQVDQTDQSLIIIEGVEVNAFFNFLLNCKSIVPPTGPFAGIPPTLLSPVAFCGATLAPLKVRENKMHSDGNDYFSIDLVGPILPSTVHNIFNVNSADYSMTMTFTDVEATRTFSKADRTLLNKGESKEKGTAIFGKENLSDCGLSQNVLDKFCCGDVEIVNNVECLKYSGETGKFSWS